MSTNAKTPDESKKGMGCRKVSIYKKRKEEGRCPRCGGVRDGDAVNCSRCLTYQRIYDRQRRAEQTLEERVEENQKKLVQTMSRYTKRRKQGLCVYCGAVQTTHWLCDLCYAKKKEREHENT